MTNSNRLVQSRASSRNLSSRCRCLQSRPNSDSDSSRLTLRSWCKSIVRWLRGYILGHVTVPCCLNLNLTRDHTDGPPARLAVYIFSPHRSVSLAPTSSEWEIVRDVIHLARITILYDKLTSETRYCLRCYCWSIIQAVSRSWMKNIRFFVANL